MSVRIYSLLPVHMADKVRRYHHRQDAYGSLLGKLLLMMALSELGWPLPWQTCNTPNTEDPFWLMALI